VQALKGRQMYLYRSPRPGEHWPVEVEVTPEEVLIRWDHVEQTAIPLDSITWISEHEDPYELSHHRPRYLTIRYLGPTGEPGCVCLFTWESTKELVTLLIQAREGARRDAGPGSSRRGSSSSQTVVSLA